MPENTIKLVVDAEKEIASMLDAERRKAAETLAQARQEIQEGLERELAGLAQLETASRQHARETAEREGEVQINKARQQAQSYAAMGEEDLLRVVGRLLNELIPEMGDDRQDEQN